MWLYFASKDKVKMVVLWRLVAMMMAAERVAPKATNLRTREQTLCKFFAMLRMKKMEACKGEGGDIRRMGGRG